MLWYFKNRRKLAFLSQKGNAGKIQQICWCTRITAQQQDNPRTLSLSLHAHTHTGTHTHRDTHTHTRTARSHTWACLWNAQRWSRCSPFYKIPEVQSNRNFWKSAKTESVICKRKVKIPSLNGHKDLHGLVSSLNVPRSVCVCVCACVRACVQAHDVLSCFSNSSTELSWT